MVIVEGMGMTLQPFVKWPTFAKILHPMGKEQVLELPCGTNL